MRSGRRTGVVGFLSVLVPAVLAAAATEGSDSAAQTARLSGPVTGGEKGAPFSAPALDLADFGYVMEEFFLEGEASAYRLREGTEHKSDGMWKTEKEASTVPWKTRLLVVRPSDAARFNGTVIAHWQNVTAGYELGTVSDDEYLRGFAWVGISAQKIGIDGFPGPDAAGLKQWDKERYGSLEHPGDAYSYDIFTQAARAVGPRRATTPVDPMGGLDVRYVVAAGASQSASRLRTYMNGVHPKEQFFDGFIPYIDFAGGVPFARDRSGAPRGVRRSHMVRSDLGVPVLVVNSETETMAYYNARQPDTDTYRFWEVAGTSHVSVTRDAAATTEGMSSPNWLAYKPVYDAALRHMHRWLSEGKLPPRFPLIEVKKAAASANPLATAGTGMEIARDAHGNALGGIRLPEMVVPTAEHRGAGERVAGGNRFAFLYGYARDFTGDELRALYPNRGSYLEKYRRALAGAVDQGFVLPEDAPRLEGAAEAWAEVLPE